jgi:hypothetical protein
MTAYNLKPPDTHPTLFWQEAKEKRRQLLASIRQRRKIISARFFAKQRKRLL